MRSRLATRGGCLMPILRSAIIGRCQPTVRIMKKNARVSAARLATKEDVDSLYAELEKPSCDIDVQTVRLVVEALVNRLAVVENASAAHRHSLILAQGMRKFELTPEFSAGGEIDLRRYPIFETEDAFYAFENNATKGSAAREEDAPARDRFLQIAEREQAAGYDEIGAVNVVIACAAHFPEGSAERLHWLGILQEGMKEAC